MASVVQGRPAGIPHGSPRWARPVAATVAGLLLSAVALTVPASPPTVPALSFENPGRRDVAVSLRGVDDQVVLSLGQVPAEGRAVFHEVLDLGPEVMVVLRYGGVSAGEVRVLRDDLERGWPVPDAVTTHFGRSRLR